MKQLVSVDDKKLQKLSDLLEKSITIYEQDRKIAIEHFEMLKDQLEKLYDGEDGIGVHMSEDAALEKAANEALKMLIKSSDKLDKVIFAATQVVTTQLNNESREAIAEKFKMGGGAGGFIPKKPVDFNQIKGRSFQELDYDEEEERD